MIKEGRSLWSCFKWPRLYPVEELVRSQIYTGPFSHASRYLSNLKHIDIPKKLKKISLHSTAYMSFILEAGVGLLFLKGIYIFRIILFA